MKHLLTLALCALVACVQFLAWGDGFGPPVPAKPTVRWMTDANPLRKTEFVLFREWLRGRAFPEADWRLDSSRSIQLNPVMRTFRGAPGDLVEAPGCFLHELEFGSLVHGATNLASRFAYPEGGLSSIFSNALSNSGRQAAFPCEIFVSGYLVNADAFAAHDLAPPPFMMDFEAFERRGLEYVAKANRGLERQAYFFARSLDLDAMRLSCGAPLFNETMTRCAVRRSEFVRVLALARRWTFTQHLVPTRAQWKALAAETKGAAPDGRLLAEGRFAMILAGREALAPLRAMAHEPRCLAVLPPHGGYPVVSARSRAVVVLGGSSNAGYALPFLGFLRSEDYNIQLAGNGEGLPPDPAFMDREVFLRPAGRSNEWALHEGLRRMARDYAWVLEESPFIPCRCWRGIEESALDAFWGGKAGADETVAAIEERINAGIDAFVKARPELAEPYREALARQERVDALKSAGKKIPIHLIDHPFLRRLGQTRGLVE